MARSLRARIVLTAAAVLLAASGSAFAARTPCSGRFLVDSQSGQLAIPPGTGALQTGTLDAVQVDSSARTLSIDSICVGDTARVAVKATKKVTKITATWKTCRTDAGVEKNVRL